MAALLLVAEMNWQRVLKYFQFLGHLYGKGFFMIFLALLLFDTNYPVDATVSVVLTLIGILNLVATCMLPKELVSSNQLLSRAARSLQGGASSHNELSHTEEESSENDADDQDHLLPQTYGNGI